MKLKSLTLFLLSSLFLVGGCSLFQEDITQEDRDLQKEALEYFKPLPKVSLEKMSNTERERVRLGKKLYFETKLSVDNSISCNSCHGLDTFGVDNERTSPGFKGQRGDRNSPSSYNAFLHVAQFWDGRAKDVEEQAVMPIMNPVEMAMPSKKEVLRRLNTEDYMNSFKNAFPGKAKSLTFKNLGRAIGAFERTLVTPSDFDRFLEGDLRALNRSEKRGLRKFMEVGCVSCHDGAAVGGGQYQVLGAVNPFKTEDVGRYAVTKDEDDKHAFKVPSLRNVEKTGPYFHDGSINSLGAAVKIMAWHQLGEKLSENDQEDILSFLGSLTGDLPNLDVY